MKFKLLTEKQIIISIDRLTRFKPTEEKYVRVFRDILISNLLEPKLKKAELENLDYAILRDFAVEIFNSSIDSKVIDLSLNLKLREYENLLFKNNEEVDKLLNNKLNYSSALNLLKQDIPVNLKWLAELDKNTNIKLLRNQKSLLYPLECVVIVEGITEEILLPKFASILGFDFLKNGVKILPAGGKNQVVKLYYSLSQELKIPIFVLLDKDAIDNKDSINKRLRDIDSVYILNSGEFEDLLPKRLIIKTINTHLKNFVSVEVSDIDKPEPMVKILEEFFKQHGIHEFKKAEFANLVKEHVKNENDISDEIKSIIDGIKHISTIKSLI